ncbi:MAG: hypothetical protein IPI67_07980 [Myxococcales bacterium]|nr:hypothetical protein [Myxococcales bacterium]
MSGALPIWVRDTACARSTRTPTGATPWSVERVQHRTPERLDVDRRDGIDDPNREPLVRLFHLPL